ncbi:MAG: hypothetical protein QM594_00170 [Niabella sp.]
MNKNFNLKRGFTIAAAVVALLASCSKSNGPDDKEPPVTKDFQLAFASGSGSISGTYLQGVTDLSAGEISFSGKGYHMSDGRVSRIFPSSDGKTVYSLTYLAGTIDKFTYNGGDNYTLVSTFDASVPLGIDQVRFTRLNDEVGSVHYANSAVQYAADGTTYLKHKITASIGLLNFSTMNFGTNFKKDIDVVLPGTLAADGYNITRIDCPVVSGGKIYYGAAVSKWNKTTGKNVATDKTFTLVLDYPALTNATVVTRDDVAGATNGYRTPTQHINEAGEILQLVSAGGKTHIVKLVNGQYTDFKFNLHEKLGRQTASNGFFYAGNGICYMPYEKVGDPQVQIGVNPQGEPTYSSAWGLARIDLNNNSAIDLTTPDGLWLQQYQYSVVRDGKFYIALSPVGVQGHIYIYDVNSTSKDGVKGAKITSGADQYYIGIY